MAESDDKVRIWTYLSLARTPSDSDSNNLLSFWLAKILSCSYSGDAGAAGRGSADWSNGHDGVASMCMQGGVCLWPKGFAKTESFAEIK